MESQHRNGSRKHYHAMSGTPGCIPDYNAHCETMDIAVSSLTDLFELSDDEQSELEDRRFIWLNPDRGASYAEVACCTDTCDPFQFD